MIEILVVLLLLGWAFGGGLGAFGYGGLGGGIGAGGLIHVVLVIACIMVVFRVLGRGI